MSTYVLVHGAWHGGWCWEKIAPLLEARGHRVLAPDLPGHGADQTPLSEVSLDAYTTRVCDVIAAAQEPVVLVGHSMGGTVITSVAERIPERLRTLVYLTAFLLGDGEALFSAAGADTGSLLIGNLTPSDGGASITVKPEAVIPAFFAECTQADAQRARERLTPQPTQPMTAPVKWTAARAGRVPRVYIACLRDRAISLSFQERMYTARPCAKVLTLDTDHSPFYSAPAALSGHLADF